MAAVLAVPASARSAPSNVGSATAYGLEKNFTLVGHTDLAKRGMNSPIAVAGRCAYVGDRYYSSSSDEKVRPNGGIAIVDVKDPRHPRETGVIPPVALSTQRELRADTALGILVVESYSPQHRRRPDETRRAVDQQPEDPRHPPGLPASAAAVDVRLRGALAARVLPLEGPQASGSCPGLRDVHDLLA